MMYFYSVISFFENAGHDELHDFTTQSNILPCNLENTKLARYQYSQATETDCPI